MALDRRVLDLIPVFDSFGLAAPTIPEVRARFKAAAEAMPAPEGVDVEARRLAGRDALSVQPAGGPARGTILYLHGGGHCFGSVGYLLGVPARLALATGHEVVAPELRLAPEHPCPASTEDAVAAYEGLLGEVDGPIAAIAGDSSGGGLTILAAVALRDRGLPLPTALAAFSPWSDLALTSQRFADDSFTDPVLPRSFLRAAAGAYLAGRPADDPTASPLHADLSGLPPTIIHVGTDEILLGDSVLLAGALAEAGVAVRLRAWPGMVHIFVAYPQLAPEADEALADTAAFLARPAEGGIGAT